MFADGVGVKLGEAVSANSAPCCRSSRWRRRSASRCSRGKDVDIALVVAKSTGEGDSSGYRVSQSNSIVDLCDAIYTDVPTSKF